MNLQTIEQKYMKKSLPNLKVGQTVKVYQTYHEGKKEKVSVFEGIIISIKGSGISKNFTVRRIGVDKIGIEKGFSLHSPTIVKIETIKAAKVARAKLYFLRKDSGKIRKFRKEKREHKVWEDETAKAEIEKITHELGEEAKKKEEKRKEKEQEFEKKFKEARPQSRQGVGTSDGGQAKGMNNDLSAKESGQSGGESSRAKTAQSEDKNPGTKPQK